MRTIRRQAKATSLDHAIELAKRHAKERRLPSKVMADLMGVELKTYYRWLLDNTLPLNRIAQFEALTGSRFISEYLSVLHGDRVVIEIPRGRKGKAADMAQVQSQTAAALALLAKGGRQTVGQRYQLLDQSLRQGYQRRRAGCLHVGRRAAKQVRQGAHPPRRRNQRLCRGGGRAHRAPKNRHV